MNRKDVAELLNRRRRQILVHSIIYYKMDDNLISDSTWSAWATELEELQKKYPDIAAKVPYAEEFKDFDHSTGMNLPLDDPDAVLKGHGEKSVMLLSQHLSLTMEEILCIRYHMGAFVDQKEWNDYTRAIHAYPNVLWTHTADMLAAHILEVDK